MPSFSNLLEALDAAPTKKPFVTMWRSEEDVQSVTFGEFRALAASIAGQIRVNGVRQGDTVILVMPQGIPLMAAFVGAMTLGSAPAILAYPNFKLDPAKYRAGLRGVAANLKARLVMIDDVFPQDLLQHVATAGDTRVLKVGAVRRGGSGLIGRGR